MTGIIHLKRNFFDWIFFLVGSFSFFMMIVTSRGFTALKMFLLLVLCILSILEIILEKKEINRGLFIYILCFVLLSAGSFVWGMLHGFSFSVLHDHSLIRYYIVTPIVAFLVGMILQGRPYRVSAFFDILALISLFTVVGDTLKIAYLSGWIPDFDILNLFFVGNIDFTEVRIRMSNEPSLMFIIPMYVYLFLVGNNTKKEKWLYGLIALFGCIYTVLSGRRALELVVGITIVYVIFKNMKKMSAKAMKTMFLIFLAGIVFIIILIRLSARMGIENIIETAKNSFLTMFKKTQGDGISKRFEEIYALNELFLESPLLGNGLNSYAASCLASTETPWSYEVYYNALLAQTGIFGISFFFFGIFSILKRLLLQSKRLYDKRYMGCLVGMIMFIISSATNPFIIQPWVWCLCIGLCFSGIERDYIVLNFGENNTVMI